MLYLNVQTNSMSKLRLSTGFCLLLSLAAIAPALRAEEKIHFMRVDCSLISGTQAVWLVAEPRPSAPIVTYMKCGEELIAVSSQDGWTKVRLRKFGSSPSETAKWVEGYIGSSLLTNIAQPADNSLLVGNLQPEPPLT